MAKPNDHGTCPSGGLWYECLATIPSFQGCCTTNPCQQAGCPVKDLRAAGIPAAGLVATNEPNVQCPSTSLWYTCLTISPTFQGCCKTDPCKQNGCPAGDLEAARFKVIPGTNSNLPTTTSFTTTLSPTPAPTRSSSTSSLTPTNTASPAQPNVSSSNGNHNTPIIAGVVTGGIVLIALIICGFLFLKSRRKKDKNVNRDFTPGTGMRKDPDSPELMRKLTPTDGIRGPESEGYYTASQGTPRPDHDKGFQPTRPTREGDIHTVGPPPYRSPQPSPQPFTNQLPNSPQISMMSGHPSPDNGTFVSPMSTWNGQPSPYHNIAHGMAVAGSTNVPQQLDSWETPRGYAAELPGVAISK